MQRAILILIGLCFSCSLLAAEKVSLSVLPFSAQKGEQQAWLAKGIADMLIRNLSSINDLVILERHELQTFLDEMELNQSAFIDQRQAMRVANVAKLQQVIYGNYSLTGTKIEIHLMLVDLPTQNLILNVKVAGKINDLHRLITQLSMDFVKQRKLPVTEQLTDSVNYFPTDSMSATEHFYQAMDYYDQGEYSEAFSHFFSASQQDPKYWEAQLWMGKMLGFLAMDDLAIAAFLSLNQQASQQTEAYDALMWAAILMEKKSPDKAIKAYQSLASLMPAQPHSILAAFRLGNLYQQEEKYLKAYQAYAQVDSFYIKQWKVAGVVRNRQSRFFRWFDVLKLAKDSIINMISLYPKLSGLPPDQLPKSPRGLITVSPNNPIYKEVRYAETESIFVGEKPYGNWREKFYVVAAPEGYVVTAIEMQLNGQLTERNRNNSFTMRVLPFPIPRNYQNTWMGVIYGQTTKPTSLKKFIPFYGKQQKILTLQFIEGASEINHWQIKLTLQAESEQAEKTAVNSKLLTEPVINEGQLHSRFSIADKAFTGIAQTLAKYWYAPKQTMALLNNYNDGLFMVFVKGELEGEQTDLMMSHRLGTQAWSKPIRLDINSQSEDFAPKLLRAEDGSIQLFWISNRRGVGWELWTSRLDPKTNNWAQAARIPLEQFSPEAADKASYQANNLLHYAVTQDKQGQWVIIYRSSEKREVIVIASQDAKQWSLMAKQRSIMKFYNPALVHDKAGVYRLLAVGSDEKIHLWSSNDLLQWRKKSYSLAYSNASSYAMHPIHLFSERADRLLVLLSNSSYGLQYARFNPDTSEPELDLVKGVALESYSVTSLADDHYLVAQQKNDQFKFYQYQQFQTQAPEVNAHRYLIYSEYMQDRAANQWRRIYARMRSIQPDVTAVAVEPDGRVWWGIETGIMTLKDDDFYTANVTEGFFHHHVTDIVPCGGITYFSSKDLDKVVLGIANKNGRRYSLRSQQINNEISSISALYCVAETLYIGTETGSLFSYHNGNSRLRAQFNGEKITAIAASKSNKQLWLGTEQGHLYQVGNTTKAITLPQNIEGKILALAFDTNDILWLSVENKGVYRYLNKQWLGSSGATSPVYKSVSVIQPDPKQGVWMMPGSQELSKGIVYSDGKNNTVFNSPDNNVTAPTGLGITQKGVVWVGTAFDGLFSLKRPSTVEVAQ